jgi:phosphoribosylformimino-5-aminoimidazole carboxamide ribotide isomerase
MIAIPAIDLREGACVQLVGGSYANERVRLDDPVGVARMWEDVGFRRLHVVDLDAALDRGSNAPLVSDILRATTAAVQAGGGVRNEGRVEELLDAGAEHVIVGTRAIEDVRWLDAMAERFPDRIIVAADVRERRIVTHGWIRTLPLNILDALDDFNTLPLAGILVTAVHREGQLAGTDLPLMEEVAEAADFPVYASGGITTMQDLRALADRGVAAAIIGMALYTGAIDARVVAEEFAE